MKTTLVIPDRKLPVCDQCCRLQPRWAARFGKRQQCDNTIPAVTSNFTWNFGITADFQPPLMGAGSATGTKKIQHDCFHHDAREGSTCDAPIKAGEPYKCMD